MHSVPVPFAPARTMHSVPATAYARLLINQLAGFWLVELTLAEKRKIKTEKFSAPRLVT